MKKIMAMMIGVAVAGAAVADLAVNFNNGSVALSVDGTAGGFVPAGTMVQLIWSATGSQTIAGGAGGYAVAGGALLPGERLLDQVFTTGSVGFFGPSASLHTDADINTGVFFTRIFSSATGAEGEFFIDVNEVDASAWVYNPVDTGTTYSDNATGASPGSIIAINGNGTTVVPEPATIGLMGVAGLGMFLARRKARR